MTEDLRKAVAEIVARSPDEVQGNGLYALLVRMGARHLRGETPFCQDDEYAKLIFPTVLKPIVCMLSAELQAWLGKGGNREPHDIRKSTAEDSNLSDSDRFLIGQTQQPAALQDGLSMLNGWFFESGTTGPIWAKALLRVEREPRETRDKKAAGFLITAGIRWLKGEVHMDDAEAFLDEQVREALSRKKEVFETIVTPAFSARDIADWESLREKLIERSDPVSKWLWDQLAVGTQDKLTRLEPDDRTLQAALLDDLNRILREPCIHGNECFQAIQLRDETERRLSVNPQGDALVRLNRLLLEDAYPKAVSRLSNRVATAYGLFGRSYSIMGPAEDVAAFARTLGLRKIELRKARRPRSSTFSVSDLVDLPSLAAKLKLPSRAFDTWFAAQLSSVTQAALANYQGQGFDPVPLQEALVKDFNKLLLQASIYNEQRFAGIDLRSETQTVMLQNPQGNDLQRLNRLLIEDAYPLEVSRNQHIARRDRIRVRIPDPTPIRDLLKEAMEKAGCGFTIDQAKIIVRVAFNIPESGPLLPIEDDTRNEDEFETSRPSKEHEAQNKPENREEDEESFRLDDAVEAVIKRLKSDEHDRLSAEKRPQDLEQSREARYLLDCLIWIGLDILPGPETDRLRAKMKQFSASDFLDLSSFARKLKNRADAVSTYLSSRLTDSTRLKLTAWQGDEPSESLRNAIVHDLNGIVFGPSIWNEARFSGVYVRPTTRDLVENPPQETGLAPLNRSLLEDAYPMEVKKKGEPRNKYSGIWFEAWTGIPDASFSTWKKARMVELLAEGFVAYYNPPRSVCTAEEMAQRRQSAEREIVTKSWRANLLLERLISRLRDRFKKRKPEFVSRGPFE